MKTKPKTEAQRRVHIGQEILTLQWTPERDALQDAFTREAPIATLEHLYTEAVAAHVFERARVQ